MKERPILFSSEMVRAILEGRKTQTRRPVKCFDHKYPQGILPSVKDTDGLPSFIAPGNVEHLCPLGTANDILYVRETIRRVKTGSAALQFAMIQYKADMEECSIPDNVYDLKPLKWGSWTPSIHMPKKFSRISLKIKNIRIERVQGMTASDAEAEGFQKDWWPTKHMPKIIKEIKKVATLSSIDMFKLNFDIIYKNRGFGWIKNPWVWIITFERITP